MSSTEGTSDLPKEVTEEAVSKQTYRKKVWETLDKNGISTFAKPYGRIPSFKGIEDAVTKLLELDEFKSAKSVEVNPDKSLQLVRVAVLEQNKDLFVPIPRLKDCLLKKLCNEGKPEDKLINIVSRWGIENNGKTIDLDDEVHIDLFVLGSVAVSKQGHRIGKGKGYADLEFAILKDMKAVDNNTVIVTVVHDEQVFDDLPVELFEKHDIPVDYIVTPTQIITVKTKLPRPEKIFWDILSQRRVTLMKILQKLKEKHEKDGVTVTLKEEDSDIEEREPQRFRYRRFRRTNPKPRSRNETEGEESRPRRNRYFNRSRSNKRPTQTTQRSSESEGVNGEGDSKPKPQKRRPNSRRPNRRFHIDFSLLVSNIERNVRVRDLKNALIEHNIKPDDITWKGYKGFCYLHYAKPLRKKVEVENGEASEETEVPFSVDNVIEVLQSLKICPDSTTTLDVKVMEPITRIETTDVSAV